MGVAIVHLLQHPEHLRLVAGWIYHAFWLGKQGYTVDTFEALLQDARDPDRVPLSLLALADGVPAGTVNLIHNDMEGRPELYPWLAALFVAPTHRHRGIGTRLVRALTGEAARLGFSQLYLGTDIPEFYAPLGAKRHEQVTESLCIMRIRLPGSPPEGPPRPQRG